MVSTKPVLVTGFFISLIANPAIGQDYIDLEAERNAARAQGGVVEGFTTPDTEAVAPPTQNSSSDDQGFKPYSGETILAAPVEEAVDTRFEGPLDNLGSLVIRVQQLQEEVLRLNGVVEEQAQQIQSLKEQSLERYVDLDRRIGELGGSNAPPVLGPNGEVLTPPVETGLGFGGAADNTSAGPSAEAPGSTGSVTAAAPGEEAAYQQAYDLVRAREFESAVAAFRAFLTDYPFGRFAPNAHYWLGELYLVIPEPDPELARQSFKLLLDQYPANPKVPDALYKLGRVHFIKGNRDRASEYLDQVISQFPGHPAAQLAEDFIDENL